MTINEIAMGVTINRMELVAEWILTDERLENEWDRLKHKWDELDRLTTGGY